MRHILPLLLLFVLVLNAQESDNRIGIKELTIVVEELIKKQNENSVKLDEIKKELLSNSKKLELLRQSNEENSQEIRYISTALKDIAYKLETNKEHIQPSNSAQLTALVATKNLKGVITTDNANIRRSSEIRKDNILFRLDRGMELTLSSSKNRGWYAISDRLYVHKTGLEKIDSNIVTLSPNAIMVEVKSSFAQLKKEMLPGNDGVVGILKKGVSLAAKELNDEWYECMETLYVHESNINIIN